MASMAAHLPAQFSDLQNARRRRTLPADFFS